MLAMIINSSVWAQDSLAQYHPLGKGNIWIYQISYPSGSYGYKRRVAKGDSTIDGKNYRIIAETTMSDSIYSTTVERYDLPTGCYYTRSGNNDVLQDSTFAFTPYTNFGGNYNNRIIERLGARTVFGAQIQTRQITEGRVVKEDVITWEYSYGLGLVSAVDLQLVNYISAWWQTLLYAKIDGIEYGKIPTKVDGGNINELPVSIVLSQNYPNPFNPSTTFSFTLPSRSFVTLKIYDVLGKEVAKVVNEDLLAATYSRTWNAALMSSGVYFYRLQVGSYIETKKLLIVR